MEKLLLRNNFSCQFLPFSTIFSIYLFLQGSTIHIHLWCGCLIYFFLNFANLICRGTDIFKYFRESLGLRDIKSRLSLKKKKIVWHLLPYWHGALGVIHVYIKLLFSFSVLPGPPLIETNSTSPLVENSVIYLTCSSQGGKPAPNIKWLRNGQLVTSAIETRPSTQLGASSSQIIVDITRQDHSANYSCVIYNAANQNSPLISYRILSVQCKYLFPRF